MKLLKQYSLVLSIFLSFFLLIGCNDDASSNSPENKKEDTSKSEQRKSESDDDTFQNHTDLLSLDPSSIDESLFNIVDFEDKPSPLHYYTSFAYNGAFILADDDINVFYDYQSGSKFNLSSDVEWLKSRAENDSVIDVFSNGLSYLFEPYYYINLAYKGGKEAIVQVDLTSGNVEHITDVDGPSTLAKKDDTLYITNNNKLFAIDVNSKEIIWEIEDELAQLFGYAELHATENALIYESDYGLIAFSREDGTKLFEEDGVYRDIAIDGNTFYALLDEGDGFSEAFYKIVEFDDLEGKKDTLIETPQVQGPYNVHDINLELLNDIFYIKFESGVLAYDKASQEQLWALSVGDIQDSSETGDDNDYWFSLAYADDKIYTLTEKSNVARETDNFLTIIDATTGEMLGHYSFGSGGALGPFVDKASGNVFVYMNHFEKEEAKAYILTNE